MAQRGSRLALLAWGDGNVTDRRLLQRGLSVVALSVVALGFARNRTATMRPPSRDSPLRVVSRPPARGIRPELGPYGPGILVHNAERPVCAS